MKIGKTYRFEAAHHLPNHNGKCKSPHGHSYRLEVEIEGTIIDEPGVANDGMLRDFAELDKYVMFVINQLDHRDLNGIEWFKGSSVQTTAEEIVLWIRRELYDNNPSGINYSRLRLYETEKAYAEWSA